MFSAWLNHTDAKAINSLDTLIVENGHSVVRHHLIDFNAALGSAGIGLRERRDGYEYLAEYAPSFKALPSLGFYIRPWMTIHYPSYRGIGRFESERFVPEDWRPREPNPAYVRSRADDTFWAARKLMAISDDLIRAGVKAGHYSDPAAAEFLIKTLIERRDKIGRAWLTAVNPIVDPNLAENGTLTFRNVAVDLKCAPAPAAYHVAWYRFDNATGESSAAGGADTATERVTAPADVLSRAGADTSVRGGRGQFIRVDISASSAEFPSWTSPVRAYFRRIANGWTLVGFERMPDAPPMRQGLVGAELK